jgi:L-iditol 2-dehydrogenase
MKAVLLKANRQFELTDLPFASLAANACRIRVRNVGVCSSDIQRSCEEGAYFYPLVMGHEFAGEIAEVGHSVQGFQVGDRVVIFPLLPCFKCSACEEEQYVKCRDYDYYGSRRHGAYAEYVDVNAWNILKLPDEVSFKDAATVEPLAVVIHALRRVGLLNASNVQMPSSLCIIGAGFLGLLMAQICHLRYPHLPLTLYDRNAFKLDIAKPYAHQTFLLSSQEEWASHLSSGENKYDLVVEASGTPSMFCHSIALANPGATVLWMGNITDNLNLSKSLASQILRKELNIMGTWNSLYRPGKSDDWKDALELISQGLRPSELVTHWISLEQVPEILSRFNDHKTGVSPFPAIKAMVEID